MSKLPTVYTNLDDVNSSQHGVLLHNTKTGLPVLVPLQDVLDAMGSGTTSDVPGVASGQTLFFREYFANAIYDGSNLGGFTGITDGEVIGSLENGPGYLLTPGNQGSRVAKSAAVRYTTAAELATGVTLFDAYYTIPASIRGSFMVSAWFRPAQLPAAGATPHLMYLTDGFGNPEVPVYYRRGVTRDIEFISDGLTGGSGTFEVDLDEWVLFYAYYHTDTGLAYCYAVSEREIIFFGSKAFSNGTLQRVRINCFSGINQPGYSGRIGPLSVYYIESSDAAANGPTDYTWPTNAKATYYINPSGDDNATSGPWQTLTGLVTAVNNCIVLSNRAKPWVDSDGVRYSYDDLPTAAAKRQWWVNYMAGGVFANGDSIIIADGDYYTPATGFIPYLSGCEIAAVNTGKVRFICGESLGGAWSQPDAGGHPKVWLYATDRVNRCVWTATGVSFMPVVFTADLAAAYATLDANDYSVFVDATGNTYISLPTGVEPDDVGPLIGSRVHNLDYDGMLVRGIVGDFNAMYKYQEEFDQCYPNAPFSAQANEGFITVFEDCEVKRWSKHAFQTVGGSGADSNGLVVVINPKASFGPPSNVTVGAYTTYVDYWGANIVDTANTKRVTIWDTILDIDDQEWVVPGTLYATKASGSYTSYYTHDSLSTEEVFALTVVKNPSSRFFLATFGDAGYDGDPKPVYHLDFEVVNPYSTDSLPSTVTGTWVCATLCYTSGFMWQDVDRRIPVRNVGDPVRVVQCPYTRQLFIAPSDSARPTLTSLGSGLYTLTFDGIDDCLVGPPLPVSGNNAMAMAASLRQAANSASYFGYQTWSAIASSSDLLPRIYQQASDSTLVFDIGGVGLIQSSALSFPATTRYIARYSGTQTKLRINGSDRTPVAYSSANITGKTSPCQVGRFATVPEFYFAGQIDAMGFINANVDDTQATRIDTFLQGLR